VAKIIHTQRLEGGMTDRVVAWIASLCSVWFSLLFWVVGDHLEEEMQDE
jgi:hypothetical protein